MSEWEKIRNGLYRSGAYTITQMVNRLWRLNFEGAVSTLTVPSRFDSLRQAKVAASIDERNRNK